MSITHEHFMREAIAEAFTALHDGEPPFACLLVDSHGKVCLKDRDRVRELRDWAAHAESNLLHRACRELDVPDLSNYTLYTTVEPCAMCFTSGWLNRLGTLVYGATIAEVAAATGGKQREMPIPVNELNERGGQSVAIIGGVLAPQCLELFSHYEFDSE